MSKTPVDVTHYKTKASSTKSIKACSAPVANKIDAAIESSLAASDLMAIANEGVIEWRDLRAFLEAASMSVRTQSETDALERADRLLAEGVSGDRGLIASMIMEAVWQEREACAIIADAKIDASNISQTAICSAVARAIRNRT